MLVHVRQHFGGAERHGVDEVVATPEPQVGGDDAAHADQYFGGGVQVLFVALGDLFNCRGGHGLSVTVGDVADRGPNNVTQANAADWIHSIGYMLCSALVTSPGRATACAHDAERYAHHAQSSAWK
ncbi:hypothetical protein ACWDSL_37720 [Streptomyces sp. NPDC000941]